jgi:hypothetical protein
MCEIPVTRAGPNGRFPHRLERRRPPGGSNGRRYLARPPPRPPVPRAMPPDPLPHHPLATFPNPCQNFPMCVLQPIAQPPVLWVRASALTNSRRKAAASATEGPSPRVVRRLLRIPTPPSDPPTEPVPSSPRTSSPLLSRTIPSRGSGTTPAADFRGGCVPVFSAGTAPPCADRQPHKIV